MAENKSKFFGGSSSSSDSESESSDDEPAPAPVQQALARREDCLLFASIAAAIDLIRVESNA
eukprot:4570650-Amphidinium_carterae.2